MKRKFYQIAKQLNVSIVKYKTYREVGMGGLQVYEIEVDLRNGRVLNFADSYFHLSGDAHKVLKQFEYEISSKTLSN